MKIENLSCLIASNNLCFLSLKKINELPECPEIDLENEVWINHSGRRVKIGEYQPCYLEKRDIDIRFVFDHTNYDHLRKALQVNADFHR